MTLPLRIVILSMVLTTMCGTAVAATEQTPETVADMGMAQEWCDRTGLRRIEGIWEFPDDHTRVLVRHRTDAEMEYDIVVVDSPDCRLKPGDTVGYIRDSPDPAKFEFCLYRTKSKGKFHNLGKCMARLASDCNSIYVSASRLKATLRSLSFLPKFWRSVRISVDRPAEDIPKGLVRIYPADDISREPTYL